MDIPVHSSTYISAINRSCTQHYLWFYLKRLKSTEFTHDIENSHIQQEAGKNVTLANVGSFHSLTIICPFRSPNQQQPVICRSNKVRNGSVNDDQLFRQPLNTMWSHRSTCASMDRRCCLRYQSVGTLNQSRNFMAMFLRLPAHVTCNSICFNIVQIINTVSVSHLEPS